MRPSLYRIQPEIEIERSEKMAQVLYNLYSYTNNSDYLEMAGYFYKEKIWDPMAHIIDSLGGNHAKTHLAQIVGVARGWEVSGNGTLRTITEGKCRRHP